MIHLLPVSTHTNNDRLTKGTLIEKKGKDSHTVLVYQHRLLFQDIDISDNLHLASDFQIGFVVSLPVQRGIVSEESQTSCMSQMLTKTSKLSSVRTLFCLTSVSIDRRVAISQLEDIQTANF